MNIKNLSWTFPMLCRVKKQADNHTLQGYCLPHSFSKAVAVIYWLFIYLFYSFTQVPFACTWAYHVCGVEVTSSILSNSVKEIRNASWTSDTEGEVTSEDVSSVTSGLHMQLCRLLHSRSEHFCIFLHSCCLLLEMPFL